MIVRESRKDVRQGSVQTTSVGNEGLLRLTWSVSLGKRNGRRLRSFQALCCKLIIRRLKTDVYDVV